MQATPTSPDVGPGPIPARAGIGLRGPHYQAMLAECPTVGWLEVHPENYFGAGGAPHHYLERLRADYPLSLHGVGLSPGSVDPLDRCHLARLRELIDRYRPGLVSEHLSWGAVDGNHLHGLLPLPYTEEALDHMVARVDAIQQALGRPILIENLSSYLEFRHSTIPEAEFLATLARRSGCGILLDINNVYVSATNHGFDPYAFVRAIPAAAVGEIHLAGHVVNRFNGGELLIDSHNRPVCDAVWSLYRYAISLLGPRPTLIEWDSDLPPLAVLVGEAKRADAVMRELCDADAA